MKSFKTIASLVAVSGASLLLVASQPRGSQPDGTELGSSELQWVESEQTPTGGLKRSVPARIAFQGFLTDNAGAPVDNEFPGVTVEVALFDAASGGTQVWPAADTELHPGVPVRNGVFEIELGALSSLDPDDFDGSALYLEVTVESEVLSPRTELLSSPFAMRSRNADQADAVAPGAAVTSVNGLTDDMSLVAGPNVTITPSGNTLTIDATGGGGADGDWTVAGDDLHSAVSGNVGVGTVSPEKKLHIAGSLLLEGTAEDIAVRDGEALQFGQWNGTEFVEKMRLNGSGKLGIGTAAPDQTLDVVGDARFGGGSVDPDGTTEFISIRGTSAMYSFQVENDSTAAESDLFVTSEAGEVLRVTNDGDVGVGTAGLPGARMEVRSSESARPVLIVDNVSPLPGVAAAFEGSVSIADGSALSNGSAVKLEGGASIHASSTSGAIVLLEDSNGNDTIELIAQENNSTPDGATLKLYDSSDTANPTIELDASYGSTGKGRVITDVIQITGGSDLSEQFDIRTEIDPIRSGMVVSIDPASPGGLRISRHAYDRRVAGIVSGAGGVNPGMLMGQRESVADGAHPVALTGRVYCRADASYGAVEPGDLLTTSDTPGHAMKVTDRHRAHGAILGKAMTGLQEGRGLVLVLVTLQ